MKKGSKRIFRDTTSGSGEDIECVNIGLPATIVAQRLDVYGYSSEVEDVEGDPYSVYWVANIVTGEKIYFPESGLLRFYVTEGSSDVFIPENQLEHFESAIGWKLI